MFSYSIAPGLRPFTRSRQGRSSASINLDIEFRGTSALDNTGHAAFSTITSRDGVKSSLHLHSKRCRIFPISVETSIRSSRRYPRSQQFLTGRVFSLSRRQSLRISSTVTTRRHPVLVYHDRELHARFRYPRQAARACFGHKKTADKRVMGSSGLFSGQHAKGRHGRYDFSWQSDHDKRVKGYFDSIMRSRPFPSLFLKARRCRSGVITR